MRKIISSFVIAGTAALAPLAANAQTPEGPYMAIQGGVNFTEDKRVRNLPRGDKSKLDMDTGYAVGGTAGYAFENVGFGAPRLELEATWRSNNIGKAKNRAGDRVRGFDNVDSLAVMVNALFDFSTGTDFYPYIGAGIGAVTGWVDTPRTFGDISDTGFGYQGILGLGYNITPHVGITADYRYTGSTSWKDSGSKYGDYANHTVMLGLRYAFGVPTPVAPVAEREVYAVPDSYIVFFDFDKSTITPEAAGIVAAAAANAQAGGTSIIELTGHTDTSGSAQYNMALSQRRAEAVARELEGNGIPRSMIATYAKGETDPLVPTGDGVREPQNRRVVIVLR